MDYLKSYKSFINSHYLSEGVRITTGVVLPALTFGYFNLLSTGIVVSLGALFVSVTDSAGPIHHRKNGMLACIAGIILATVVVGFASASPYILPFILFIICFFFSMIGVYGARATSIGTAVMLVTTLTIDPRLNLTTPEKVLTYSAIVAGGGFWYMSFSLLLYNFRPYRLLQQALGDCIQATSQYLLTRAEFYKKEVNYDDTFKQLLQQQATVQHKQSELAELIFKTRSVVKETTNIGRALVMIHLDVVDIFERIMASHQEYPLLHQYFDDTEILNEYHRLAQELGHELEDIGLAVKSGERSRPARNILEDVSRVREKLDELRLSYLQPDNIEGFISLRRILENVQDIAERLAMLHKYTDVNSKVTRKKIRNLDYQHLISSQQITPGLFLNNLTLSSDIFRHSLRVSIAVVAGFLVALLFNVGHSYWILLTIVVILKPAFSLTKQRNIDRLSGTFAGALIGFIILHFVHNNNVLLALLIVFMAAAYTFFRTNYLITVLLMTAYLLIFYHFLSPQNFKILLKERIVDTLIASAIAFVASSFLFPSWERKKFKPAMVAMLGSVKDYFAVIADSFGGRKIDKTAQQVARKEALIALANLSDAFNRMLSEPKSQQQGIEVLHQFVVLNHMLTSYIATLSHYIQVEMVPDSIDEFIGVAADIQQQLADAINFLNREKTAGKPAVNKEALRRLNDRVNSLMQKRRQELQQGRMETATRKLLFDQKSVVDQFNLIFNVAADLNKITQTIKIY